MAFRADEDAPLDDDHRGVARVRRDRVVVRRAREGRGDGRRRHLGRGAAPRRPRATTRSRAASPTRSPSRWPRRRSPTCCGWRPRRPTWHDAGKFADAIHAVFPDKMLAYNLSPSFNWDTTGMSDDEMRELPGGARASWASCSTSSPTAATRSTAWRRRSSPPRCARTACWPWPGSSGSSAWWSRPTARRRPWSAGPRADAALMARSGQTATTKAMGEGSTQSQHLVQTEVPPKLLTGLARDLGRAPRRPRAAARLAAPAHRRLRAAGAQRPRPGRREAGQRRLRDHPGPARPVDPVGARPEHLRPGAAAQAPDDAAAPVPHPPLQGGAIHYLTPTEDNHRQCESLQQLGIFESIYDEVGRDHRRRRQRRGGHRPGAAHQQRAGEAHQQDLNRRPSTAALLACRSAFRLRRPNARAPGAAGLGPQPCMSGDHASSMVRAVWACLRRRPPGEACGGAGCQAAGANSTQPTLGVNGPRSPMQSPDNRSCQVDSPRVV